MGSSSIFGLSGSIMKPWILLRCCDRRALDEDLWWETLADNWSRIVVVPNVDDNRPSPHWIISVLVYARSANIRPSLTDQAWARWSMITSIPLPWSQFSPWSSTRMIMFVGNSWWISTITSIGQPLIARRRDHVIIDSSNAPGEDLWSDLESIDWARFTPDQPFLRAIKRTSRRSLYKQAVLCLVRGLHDSAQVQCNIELPKAGTVLQRPN
jgi:hypothetical protein